MQGLGKGEPESGGATGNASHKTRAHAGSESKSGPPGTGVRLPGAEIASAVSKGQNLGMDMKEKVTDMISGKLVDNNEKQEKLGQWAADMNRRQVQRQDSQRKISSVDPLSEKRGLDTVPEAEGYDTPEGVNRDASTSVLEHSPATSSTTTATVVPPLTEHNGRAIPTADPSFRPSSAGTTATTTTTTAVAPNLERITSPSNASFVGYSEALNMNVANSQHQLMQRRRRRATTQGSRRMTLAPGSVGAAGGAGGSVSAGAGGGLGFTASDDILDLEEAEELLNCVQGSLVLWPYDWYVLLLLFLHSRLCPTTISLVKNTGFALTVLNVSRLDKVEAGSNWLYPLDQISPIEI